MFIYFILQYAINIKFAQIYLYVYMGPPQLSYIVLKVFYVQVKCSDYTFVYIFLAKKLQTSINVTRGFTIDSNFGIYGWQARIKKISV